MKYCSESANISASPPHRAVSSSPTQPSGGRRRPLTGITTDPNTAYFEISVEKGRPLQLQPSEPLYDTVDDSTVRSVRAKKGVHRSLPRFAASPPPRLPPSHPNRSQSLPRGKVAPPTAKEAPPTAKEAPPTAKEAPPDPEDSPMGNRPPAPLPEDARESDEDEDACV